MFQLDKSEFWTEFCKAKRWGTVQYWKTSLENSIVIRKSEEDYTRCLDRQMQMIVSLARSSKELVV